MKVYMCPECWQGKHGNCDSRAWDDTRDEETTCTCWQTNHESCAHCGDPLTRRDCDDGLNHCTDCRRACKVCGADAKEDR